jgi:hypothetical protein
MLGNPKFWGLNRINWFALKIWIFWVSFLPNYCMKIVVLLPLFLSPLLCLLNRPHWVYFHISDAIFDCSSNLDIVSRNDTQGHNRCESQNRRAQFTRYPSLESSPCNSAFILGRRGGWMSSPARPSASPPRPLTLILSTPLSRAATPPKGLETEGARTQNWACGDAWVGTRDGCGCRSRGAGWITRTGAAGWTGATDGGSEVSGIPTWGGPGTDKLMPGPLVFLRARPLPPPNPLVLEAMLAWINGTHWQIHTTFQRNVTRNWQDWHFGNHFIYSQKCKFSFDCSEKHRMKRN